MVVVETYLINRQQYAGEGEIGFTDGDATRHRYEQMLANSTTAAVCAGADNLVVSWNTASEDLFGYSAEQAIGKPLSIIIPAKLRAAHEAGLAEQFMLDKRVLRAVRSTFSRSMRRQGKSGLSLSLSLSMWTEGSKPMFGALLRDIADRHEAKKRLEHLAHCDTLTSLLVF